MVMAKTPMRIVGSGAGQKMAGMRGREWHTRLIALCNAFSIDGAHANGGQLAIHEWRYLRLLWKERNRCKYTARNRIEQFHVDSLCNSQDTLAVHLAFPSSCTNRLLRSEVHLSLAKRRSLIEIKAHRFLVQWKGNAKHIASKPLHGRCIQVRWVIAHFKLQWHEVG